MPLDNPTPGYNLAAEYQVPGIPYVSSSIISGVVRCDFPQLTKTLFVRNLVGAGSIRVGFTLNGINAVTTNNYRTLATGEIFNHELRCTQLFVSGSGNTVEILAGLTGIPVRNGIVLSGSNGNVGVG